jgi:hypothetical protein
MTSEDGKEESAKERVAKLIAAAAAEEKDKQNVTHKELREQLEETAQSPDSAPAG